MRAERLKSRKHIQTLFREGKAFSVFPLKVYYRQMDPDPKSYPVQIGFAIPSRAFPKAVDRNLIRRRIREAWRLQKHTLYHFLQGNNISLHIFIVFTGRETPAYSLINDKVSVILKKLEKELTA